MGVDHRRESKHHSKAKKVIGTKNLYMKLLIKVNISFPTYSYSSSWLEDLGKHSTRQY